MHPNGKIQPGAKQDIFMRRRLSDKSVGHGESEALLQLKGTRRRDQCIQSERKEQRVVFSEQGFNNKALGLAYIVVHSDFKAPGVRDDLRGG